MVEEAKGIMPSVRRIASAVLLVILAGCSGSDGSKAADVPTPFLTFSPYPTTPGAVVTEVPQASDDTASAPPTQYELGAGSQNIPPTQCADQAIANWTASTGTVVVTVYADGPTSLTITINGGNLQTGQVLGGQTVHDFEYPNVDPQSVSQVLVTATDSPQEKGGSCIVQGSPTD